MGVVLKENEKKVSRDSVYIDSSFKKFCYKRKQKRKRKKLETVTVGRNISI